MPYKVQESDISLPYVSTKYPITASETAKTRERVRLDSTLMQPDQSSLPVWVCVCVFLMKCKELNKSNKLAEFTSPTAMPAVLLWLCRGLSFSCLPALKVVWTVKTKRSHFLLFTLLLSFSLSPSLSYWCLYSFYLWSIKLSFSSALLPSLACCSFHLSLTFTFSLAAEKEITSYPDCTPICHNIHCH